MFCGGVAIPLTLINIIDMASHTIADSVQSIKHMITILINALSIVDRNHTM